MSVQKNESLISCTEILLLHSIFAFKFLEDPEKIICQSR